MARIRLFLLAVMCWLCFTPAAHAVRPPSPAELQLKGETPCQQPLAYWPEGMSGLEVRNGLFVLNNPLRYTDPTGHWGQEAADWWSGTVGSGANYISASPSHWIYNGTVGTVNSLVGGLASPLTLGSAAGHVSGNPNATAKDYAVATVVETANAAAVIPVAAGIGKGVGMGAGVLLGAGEKEAATEVVQRAMSQAELQATKDTGLLRGGREGTHYASDAVNSGAKRAQQRLSLKDTPEVKATLEVPAGKFSAPSKVEPKFGMPGGGTERTASGNIPVTIKKVEELK